MTGTNNRLLILLLAVLFGFLKGQQAEAQTFAAEASLDTNEILIGDQVRYQWSISGPAEYHIIPPVLNDTVIDKIEILEQSDIDTISAKEGERLALRKQMILTSFDSGEYRLPPLKFIAISPEKDSLEVLTNEQFLTVNTVEVDTTEAIKDIKGPIEEPFTLEEAMPYIMGGLALAAIILAAIYIIRRLKKKKPILVKPKPKVPPHVTAYNELEKLKKKKLWQNNFIKQYYTELTDIIRMYIEGRFDINAMEMITSEILESLQTRNIPGDSLRKLEQTLTLADLVKFAKANPLPTEHDESMKNTIAFVDETKAKAIPASEEQSKETDNEEDKQNKSLTEGEDKNNAE